MKAEQSNEARVVVGCAHLDVPDMPVRLWLAWTDHGLRNINFAEPGSGAEEAFGDATSTPAQLPEPYSSVLVAYFAGDDVDPASLPIDPTGTAFQLQVWGALRQVPRGAVRSYAGIAADVGSPRAMRAVGAANGANPIPIVVPCHRVVETGMGLGGYSGGLHRKRFLLQLEGVKVVSNFVQPGQLELI